MSDEMELPPKQVRRGRKDHPETARPEHEDAEHTGATIDEAMNALEGLSAQDLSTVIEKATALRATKIDSEKKVFFDRVRAEAAQLGISLSDLVQAPQSARRGKAAGGGDKSPTQVKFRGPNEGDTWTGRGRMPNWLAALEAEGHQRDEYLVDKPAD